MQVEANISVTDNTVKDASVTKLTIHEATRTNELPTPLGKLSERLNNALGTSQEKGFKRGAEVINAKTKEQETDGEGDISRRLAYLNEKLRELDVDNLKDSRRTKYATDVIECLKVPSTERTLATAIFNTSEKIGEIDAIDDAVARVTKQAGSKAEVTSKATNMKDESNKEDVDSRDKQLLEQAKIIGAEEATNLIAEAFPKLDKDKYIEPLVSAHGNIYSSVLSAIKAARNPLETARNIESALDKNSKEPGVKIFLRAMIIHNNTSIPEALLPYSAPEKYFEQKMQYRK